MNNPFKIDKLSDEQAKAGIEANLEGGEADGTFIVPGRGKRPVLRKTICFSTRRPSARPRSFSPTETSETLDADLYILDSENDSLDELGELETR